uniref:Uncharacterized protein n=1 Tax=Anguilla anguilla TaxID=7936 RepID=A0A0E9QHB1_ANGAN
MFPMYSKVIRLVTMQRSLYSSQFRHPRQ